jgi:hypothetical protein
MGNDVHCTDYHVEFRWGFSHASFIWAVLLCIEISRCTVCMCYVSKVCGSVRRSSRCWRSDDPSASNPGHTHVQYDRSILAFQKKMKQDFPISWFSKRWWWWCHTHATGRHKREAVPAYSLGTRRPPLDIRNEQCCTILDERFLDYLNLSEFFFFLLHFLGRAVVEL